MSYTSIRKTNGLSIIVSNTLLDASGTPRVVSNNALDTAAGIHSIYGATVALTPLTIIEFELYDNRTFEL